MAELIEDFKILRLSRDHYKEIDYETKRQIRITNFDGFGLTFANHTDKVLKVKGRFGMVKTIKPELNPINRTMYGLNGSRPGVSIRIEVSVLLEDVKENMIELEKSKLTSVLSAELLYKLRQEWEIYEKRPYNEIRHVKAVSVELLLLIPEMELKRGYKYFPELDLTIGLFHYSEETPPVPHPNTQDQLTKGTDNILDYFYKGGHDDESLNLSIKVLESVPGTFRKRFVNVFGDIYKVPISSATNVEKEGVYIKRNYGSVAVDGEVDKNQTMYFSLKEAKEKFGLDDTAEGAKIGGDPKVLAELELVQKRKEVEELKVKSIYDKYEMDKEKHQLDLEERRIKLQIDRHKAIADIEIKLAEALSKFDNKRPSVVDSTLGSVAGTIKSLTGLLTAGLGLKAFA